ncbi:MAG TPA: hypothetical protein DCQ64_28535 [Candidatus Rokubacteria bacterium]|nr:hypothetical protein [Candidatus Rokubacteria bacterium]
MPKWRDAALLGLIAVLLLGATVTRPNLVLVTGRGLLFPNGTVAAPSIAAASDPATGFYFPAVGQMTWVINSSRRVSLISTDFRFAADQQMGWSDTSGNAESTLDTTLVRSGVGIVGSNSGAKAFSMNQIQGNGALAISVLDPLQFDEESTPTGVANKAILYADDSAGKTRLMVIFGSGVAQQIAIEP